MIDTTSKRQKEIIEIAGKLLMEKGIKGLTTKNLAIEMNFSESALYRHFKNKEDLIILLLEYLMSNIIERLDKIKFENKTGIEKLEFVFDSQFHFFYQNPHFLVAILSEGLFDESEKINKAIVKIIQYKTSLITSLIEECKQNNEILNTITSSDIVHILMGSFRMMMLKWKFSNFEIDLISSGNSIMKTNLNLFKLI